MYKVFHPISCEIVDAVKSGKSKDGLRQYWRQKSNGKKFTTNIGAENKINKNKNIIQIINGDIVLNIKLTNIDTVNNIINDMNVIIEHDGDITYFKHIIKENKCQYL